MSITVRWDDEDAGRVVLDCDRDWDWVALRQAALDVIALEASAGRTVDVIVDLRRSAARLRLNDVAHIRQVMRVCPEGDHGLIVLVTRDPLFGVMAGVVVRLFTRLAGRMYLAPTLEEARQLITRLKQA